ncbi:MAG: hypothetical protein IT486_08960 [Gammaproteobacteria bacterium]|nr:hypothetical protein [Gammaproteobacteria bacterium]
MHPGRLFPAVLCVFPVLAGAGEIYGKVSLGAAPAGAGLEVAARCGDRSYPAVKTDATGSYNLVVEETGKCTLTVTREGASASLAVASYEDAAQADIVLEVRDGQLTARRR